MRASGGTGSRGFTLIELLVVVGVIAVLAATALPAIGRYVRNYQIRGASHQVAGALQQARLRAISKNVNLGVIFAVVSASQYQVVVEDDQNPTAASPPYPAHWRTVAAESWTSLQSLPGQAGPLQALPTGIEFASPATCPAPPSGAVAGAATDWAVRFGRLGTACGLSTASCGGVPLNPYTGTSYINFNPATSLATVCLFQPTTGLRRWVNVTTGGRVQAMP